MINRVSKLSEDHQTLSRNAYATLREDILSGALAPGSRLRIEALRKKYGIGPTPLREALLRLASDGLVKSVEHRGFSIPAASLTDLRDITNQRKLIECAALRAAIDRADEEFESRVLAAYYRLSRTDERLEAGDQHARFEWEHKHREYHLALTGGSRSPWLQHFQQLLFDQADRYRRLYLAEQRDPKQARKDHKLLLDATLDRDADAACACLEVHIERVFQVALDSPYFKDDPYHAAVAGN